VDGAGDGVAVVGGHGRDRRGVARCAFTVRPERVCLICGPPYKATAQGRRQVQHPAPAGTQRRALRVSAAHSPFVRGSPQAAKDAFASRQTLAPRSAHAFQFERTAAEWSPGDQQLAPPHPCRAFRLLTRARSLGGARRRSGRPTALPAHRNPSLSTLTARPTHAALSNRGVGRHLLASVPVAQVCACRRHSPATARTVLLPLGGNR
jgi:hypothetical protein